MKTTGAIAPNYIYVVSEGWSYDLHKIVYRFKLVVALNVISLKSITFRCFISKEGVYKLGEPSISLVISPAEITNAALESSARFNISRRSAIEIK